MSRINTPPTGKEKCMPKCTVRESSRHYSCPNVPFDHRINVSLLHLKLIYIVKLEILNSSNLAKEEYAPQFQICFKKKLHSLWLQGGRNTQNMAILYHPSTALPKP
jgi:hypothetical protein